MQWASGLNVLAGLWLVAAPFVLAYSDLQAALWNDIVVGVLVAGIAVVRVSGAYRATWLSWTNVVLGVWLIAAPFVLGYSDTTAALWNDIVVGVIIAGLGAWSAMASPRGHDTPTGS